MQWCAKAGAVGALSLLLTVNAAACDITSVTDESGKPVLNEYAVEKIHEYAVPCADVERLVSITNEAQETVFDDYGEIVVFFLHNCSVEYVRQLMSITQDEKQLFSDGSSIVSAWYARVTPGFASSLATLKEKEEFIFNNAEDIILFRRAYGTVHDAAYLARSGISSSYLMRRYVQLGVTDIDTRPFVDTNKPNAVLVFPSYDPERIYETEYDVDFYAKLQQQYDVRTVFVEQEADLCNTLLTTPAIELLIISAIEENKQLKFSSRKDETVMLDATDEELANYMHNLLPDATILLNADHSASLADKLAEWTGRKTIASSGIIRRNQLIVTSWHPFDVIMYNGTENVKYVVDQ